MEAEEDGNHASIAEVVIVEAGVLGESFGAYEAERKVSSSAREEEAR